MTRPDPSAPLAAPLASEPDLAPPPRGPSWHGGALRVLSSREADVLLRHGYWGTLSTVSANGRPHGTPLSYGWDGRVVYVQLGEGRTLRQLEGNPWVSLTVVQAATGLGWTSAILSGRAAEVHERAEEAHALEVLRAQRERTGSVSEEERHFTALIRIDPVEISGRARR